jgi:hypothetical protein
MKKLGIDYNNNLLPFVKNNFELLKNKFYFVN